MPNTLVHKETSRHISKTANTKKTNPDNDESVSYSLPSADFGVPVAFTRYLYEKTEVLHSLLFALLNKQREEALFWAYELYYSGCEDELVGWIHWIYNTFYASVDVWFREFMKINLARMWSLHDKQERDCLIGTIVSNLAHREFDIQYFAKTYMKLSFAETKPAIRNHRIYIRFRPRDLTPYQTAQISSVGCSPANYLRAVSRFPIRKNESLFLQAYVASSYESGAPIDTAKPYLEHWLYFASHTPLWKQRILAYSSARINHEKQMVEFDNDDHAEAFYQEYGYEPDEQAEDIHLLHGVQIYSDHPGQFQALDPHVFISVYSRDNIVGYSDNL